MSEILRIPDNIPSDLLQRAECVIVLPSVLKFALGIGGSYGRGLMVCRGGDLDLFPFPRALCRRVARRFDPATG